MSVPVIKYGATWGGINPLTQQPYKWGDPIYYDSPIAPNPFPPDIMNTPLIHVNMAFARLTLGPLEVFGSNVSVRMLANAAIFTNAPSALAALSPAVVIYTTSVDAAKDGGKQLNADKLAKGKIVIGLLRVLAAYVQAIPGISLEDAMKSGFVVTASGHHTPVVLGVPAILSISNINSGVLGPKIKGVKGATGYEFRLTVAGTATEIRQSFSSTRKILLINLVPGTLYLVEVRARAGNNAASAWSDPSEHRCT